jgi:hypothetical protein
MDEKLVQEILDELFSSLEALETRSAAVLEFLKDKGLATDEELAPHFEQAANASNVRWRAARVRINHLLSSALKPDEKVAEKKTAKAPENSPDLAVAKKTDPTKDEKGAQNAQKPTGDAKPEDVVTAAEKSDNKQGEKNGRSAEDADKDKT